MKVLWFEISIPSQYLSENRVISGWQDSLEAIVRNKPDIELFIAFEGKPGMKPKLLDGITYIPLIPSLSYWDKKFRLRYDRMVIANKLTPLAVEIINQIKPDVIHVFGTEWSFGQVAKYTNIPVVIHMQGCIAPYNNALFPPNYSILDKIATAGFNLREQYHLWQYSHYIRTWENLERDNFKAVKYYMGRTAWDKGLCELFHKGSKYYYCSEALRPSFISSEVKWEYEGNSKLRLVTVGCSSYWKGIDTVLKTANLLKQNKIDFEWNLAGNMPVNIKREVERKEKLKFDDCNVNIMGFVKAGDLVKLLVNSNFYIHTAYIDNSPNSVCEAQYLGLPIIATYVGGIPSLIKSQRDGLLVPANDPYTLAYEIIQLQKDTERQLLYSRNSRTKAVARHNPDTIYADLLNCYKSIIN